MAKDIARKVIKRAVLEFGPPLLFGLWWMYLNWALARSMADWVAHFSAGFVVPAWVWSNLLRIHYQQSTRVQQANIAGGVEDVDKQVKDLGADLQTVKAALAILTPKIEAVLPALPPKDAKEITGLVETANTHIATANTKYDAVSYRLKAEPGRFRVTFGSE